MLHDLDCRAAVRKTAGRRCRSWVPRMVLGPLLGSPSSVRLIWRLEGLFFAALCFLAPATSSRAEEPSDCTAVSRTSQNYPAHVKALIEKYGGEEFRNPVSVRPTSTISLCTMRPTGSWDATSRFGVTMGSWLETRLELVQAIHYTFDLSMLCHKLQTASINIRRIPHQAGTRNISISISPTFIRTA